MIRFAQFDTALSQTVAPMFVSVAGALLCAAVMLTAALPLAPIA